MPARVKYQFINENITFYSISELCYALSISREGYYSWKKCKFSKRAQEDKQLLEQIKFIHSANRGIYGSPRIHDDLKELGHATTNSKHNYPVHPNLLEQNFTCDTPNTIWTTDITYIRTNEGWLYLAVVLDLHSRMIVGWSMDKNMTKQLAIDALVMAYWKRKPGLGLIHHSDRGSQYASHDYQNTLKKYGMICSMSKKGDCYDNAVTESFFHTLKMELIFGKKYDTRYDAKSDIFNYIESYYNRRRKHSTLGYCSPAKFEQYYENREKCLNWL